MTNMRRMYPDFTGWGQIQGCSLGQMAMSFAEALASSLRGGSATQVPLGPQLIHKHDWRQEVEMSGWADGCRSPALPVACSAVPVGLGRTHSSGNSTGQQVGRARQLHSDSTDGVWTWGLARHRTALLAKRAWLYSHYLQRGHLWLWWVLRSRRLVVGPGWASRLSIQAPQEDLHT